MVSIRDNAIAIEVGFRIDYSWAIVLKQRMRASIRRNVNAVKAWGSWQADRVHVKAQAARMTSHAAVTSCRDRAAAALLGIPVSAVPQLRAVALSPQAVQAVPQAKGAVKAKGGIPAAVLAAQAVPLERPRNGANVNAKVFTNAVGRVAKAVSARTSLPILAHVLVTPIGNDKLELQATDLEVGCKLTIPAGVGNLKACAVPAKALIDALKGTSGTVNLFVDGDTLVLTAGAKTARFPTLPAAEFPLLPEVLALEGEFPNIKKVAPESTQFVGLTGMLKRLLPSCSPDESRAILMGVKFEKDCLAATDTHRLVVCEHGAGLPIDEEEHVVVPNTCLSRLGAMLGASDGDVIGVGIGESQVKFTLNGTEVVSRRIEGQFPNIYKVIPAEGTEKGAWYLDSEQFGEAVKAVASAAAENCNRVIYHAHDGRLDLAAGSDCSGRADSSVGLVNKDSEEFTVAYNARYMLDALAALGPGTIELAYWGDASAAVLRNVDTPGTRVVLMPMQIG